MTSLLVPDDARWVAATRHRFLDQVREGTLTPAAFDTWLVQDHRFVADLLRFQARLLARAPRPAQAVLAAGCVALVEELAWFETWSQERGLVLGAAALPATSAYAGLLDELDRADWPTALASLWLLERVYLEAWAHARAVDGRGGSGAAARYRAYVEHWTAPGFASYVDALGVLAEAVAAEVDRDVLGRVLAQEVDFWEMACGEGGS